LEIQIQISENNSETTSSEEEDDWLQNLFGLPDLFNNNMATQAQVARILENALGYTPNALNGALNVGDSILERIQGVNDRVNIVETEVMTRVPKFKGREDEDVEEWIGQIEALFTASGRNAGVNNARIAQFAIGGLEGAALQWYTDRKTLNAGNLVN
jgi:hypothetical protein